MTASPRNLTPFSELYNPGSTEDPTLTPERMTTRTAGWLKRHLGATALSLYGSLVWWRDQRPGHERSARGPVWASAEALRRHTRPERGGVSLSTFKRAMRRLRDAGLVKQDPWSYGHAQLRRYGHVARGKTYGARDGTMVRIVRGRFRKTATGTLVDLPCDVVKALEKAENEHASRRSEIADEISAHWIRRYRLKFNRLYRRHAAGFHVKPSDGIDWRALFDDMGPRPDGYGLAFIVDPCTLPWPDGDRQAVEAHARGVFSAHNLRWASRSEQLRDTLNAATLIAEAKDDASRFRERRASPRSTKVAPPINQSGPQLTSKRQSSFSKEKEQRFAEPESTPSIFLKNGNGKTDRMSEKNGTAEIAAPVRGSRESNLPDGLAWIPPYPQIGEICIPPPPRLREDMTDAELARALVVAYRAACERHLGVRSFAFARGDITKSKHYRKIVAGARAILEHDIEPHGWAAFSMEQIQHARDNAPPPKNPRKKKRKMGGKPKPPPITVVFSPSRIAKSRGWYRSERENYTAKIGIFPQSYRDLVQEWTNCVRELRLDPRDEVLFRHFPGGRDEFFHRLRAAKADAIEIRDRVMEDARRGRWVWQ